MNKVFTISVFDGYLVYGTVYYLHVQQSASHYFKFDCHELLSERARWTVACAHIKGTKVHGNECSWNFILRERMFLVLLFPWNFC